jgi:tetratricopeptide (TPR) repeat protein
MRERLCPPGTREGEPVEDLISAYNNRATIRYLRHDYAHARDDYAQALARIAELKGRENAKYASGLRSVALCDLELGATDAARVSLQDALRIREAIGLAPQDLATVRRDLADVALESGDPALATTYINQALPDLESAFGPAHPQTTDALIIKARVLLAANNPAGARPLIDACREALLTRQPSDPDRLAEADAALGAALLAAGDPSAAIQSLDPARATLLNAYTQANRRTQRCTAALIEAHRQLGHDTEVARLSIR